ncbi:hypothetical protein [Promineifilum sp.]|uniref:hypothetical protein n=1 Tax=Promineifilum sp. TaxID=2664178 RepID=UPI0035AF065A
MKARRSSFLPAGRRAAAGDRPASSSPRTNWNTVLLEQIRLAGLPEPIREYVFHANRNWRFDFCWREGGLLVACEIEGGIWMQTETGRSKGHAHPERFEQDCEKYNEAALYGWTLIRVTPDMIRDGRALDWLDRALRP